MRLSGFLWKILFLKSLISLSSESLSSLYNDCRNDVSYNLLNELSTNVSTCLKFDINEGSLRKKIERETTFFIEDPNQRSSLMCYDAYFPKDVSKFWGTVQLCAGEKSNCERHLYVGPYSNYYDDCTALQSESGKFIVTYSPPIQTANSANMSVKIIILRIALRIKFEEIHNSYENKSREFKCRLALPESNRDRLNIYGEFEIFHKCGNTSILLNKCVDKHSCSAILPDSCNNEMNRILCRELFTKKEAEFDIVPESEFGSWSTWSDCSVSCGKGYSQRTRLCKTHPNCKESVISRQSCNAGVCSGDRAAWGPWSTSTGCSVTCGEGQSIRTRVCTISMACEGSFISVQFCNEGACQQFMGYQFILIIVLGIVVAGSIAAGGVGGLLRIYRQSNDNYNQPVTSPHVQRENQHGSENESETLM